MMRARSVVYVLASQEFAAIIDGRTCSIASCNDEATECVVDSTACDCAKNDDCGALLLCSVSSCDSTEGVCIIDDLGCECTQDTQCDDENPCTSNTCSNSGVCGIETKNDGVPCGESGLCIEGACRDDMAIILGGSFRVGCSSTRCIGPA